MSNTDRNNDLTAMGLYLSEDGTLHLKNFSLKIDFSGTMTPKVLKNAASGLDNILITAARLMSDVAGENLVLEGISVGTVQSGSCGFKDIALVIRETKNLIGEIKDMDYKKLLTICLTGLALFSIDRFSQYKTAELATEAQAESAGGIIIKDSTITITDSLNALYPGQEEIVNKVVQAMANMQEKSPRNMRKFAKGLTELSHPGDIEATGVQFGSDKIDGSETSQTLLTEEQIKLVPAKLPPEETTNPEPELCRNVQIAIIKIDKESDAENAIQCRIVDEDYSNKKCPLIVENASQREEIMKRFHKNINVNLYAIKQYQPSGEMKLKAYILKDILD
ncbi:MAG: hypothetical protein IKZ07_06040 [Akkermansia sp.]|nr:hypothetical protein [Akkermansia sp.]